MTIMRNLQKVHASIVLDIFRGGTLAVDLAGFAMEAMMQGKGSQAWIDYMSLFVDNTDQLNRLKEDADLAGRPWLKQSRAYIVANACCDASTTTMTGDRVDPRIDDGLPVNSDGLIVKKLVIPDPPA